jgi:hypothetical protein
VGKKTRSKAGTWPAATTTTTAADVRSVWVDETGNRWRWVVDNRMRDYGDIDYQRRVIRINHTMHKQDGERLIDTLFHEELHRLFPNLGERAVCDLTRTLLPTLNARYRNWLYARIKKRC